MNYREFVKCMTKEELTEKEKKEEDEIIENVKFSIAEMNKKMDEEE